MNRFIAFLKCSTEEIFCLPLSIKTLFSEISVTQILLLAGDSHCGACQCMYNQEVFFPASFTIFVLNLIYHFMERPLWSFTVDSPVLNNLVLTFSALSLLGNPEGPPRPFCASSSKTDHSFLSFALSNCLSMPESSPIAPDA